MLLAIDPGLRACGVAAFHDGKLIASGFPSADGGVDIAGELANMNRPKERSEAIVGMVRGVKEWAARLGSVTELAIEMPKIYPRGSQRKEKKGTDPNDLIHLAAVVGALCAAFGGADTTVYLPQEWKGQVPKKIHHERARGRLTPEELAKVPKMAASKLHNLMDGVALGLHHVGRLG